jgi:hypothetical protein
VYGLGEGEGGDGGVEESVVATGDFPVIGGDVDETAVGGGQVEEDFAGDGACAAGTDAMPDGEALVILGLLGLSFEMAEDGVEGLGGGDGIELIEALVEEPVAEGGGADREDEEAVGRGFGEADEDLTVGGREGEAAAGDKRGDAVQNA